MVEDKTKIRDHAIEASVDSRLNLYYKRNVTHAFFQVRPLLHLPDIFDLCGLPGTALAGYSLRLLLMNYRLQVSKLPSGLSHGTG